jgi:protein-tyrosine phosphatase
MDTKELAGQPAHFRSSRQIGEEYKGNTTGLTTLRCSGSAIFSVEQLTRMDQEIEGDILVVDLRQESHAFLNGLPVTWEADNDWVNVGKTPKQCAVDEQSKVDQLRSLLKVNLDVSQDREGGITSKSAQNSQSTQVSVRNVKTEKDVVENLGLSYRRFYVTDHLRPDDAAVEAFVQLIDKLPEKVWIHFHCRGGKGRTTTFMAMYDMLRNSNKVSIEDILARQAALDPKYNLTETKPESPRTTYYQERYQFLQAFYQYTQERDRSGVRVPWSLWCRVQPKT